MKGRGVIQTLLCPPGDSPVRAVTISSMKIPVVELSDCILCGVCVEACSEAFRFNDVGYVEVIELRAYPEKEVNEAIKNCPSDCIYWEKE